MPSLSTNAIRTSSRLVLAAFILVIFMSGNVCAFSLSSLVPSEGDFNLGQWQGGAAGAYEWDDTQTSSSGGSTSVTRNRFDEIFYLRNNGSYFIDPRLLVSSSGCNFDFFQEDDKYSSSTGHTNGTLIGWDTNYTLLPEMPYTATFFSHRTQTDNSTDFGGTTDSTDQIIGAIASLRENSFLSGAFPHFSGDVYANEIESDQTTSQLGESYKNDETRDTVGADGYKGFETADLDVNWQFINDKYTGSARYSFITNWLSTNYSLDFGPTLNRNWTSQISYLTRSGEGTDESFLYGDEKLRIDHFKNLSTIYEYLVTYNDSNGQSDLSNNANFQVQYRPFRNLVSTFTLQGFYETLSPGGHLDFGAVELNQDYTHPIPLGGILSLGGDGRYEIDQNHTSGPITVLNEQHTAPAFFGPGIGFDLNNPLVVTSTIVMYDTRGGARIATTPGVDYVIAAQGQFTQIVILPTTLVILPGDPLVVNYSYVAGVSGRYSTTTLEGDVGLTFSWIALSFAHTQSSESLQSGTGGEFLTSTHQETARVDLHKDLEWVDADTNALYQVYHTRSYESVLNYTMENFGQYLTFRPASSTTLRVDGTETFTDFTDPTKHTSALAFETALDRAFSGSGNYLTVFARALQLRESLEPTEKDYETGLRAEFRYGKFYVQPWFSWVQRSYFPTKVNDVRIMLRIGREL